MDTEEELKPCQDLGPCTGPSDAPIRAIISARAETDDEIEERHRVIFEKLEAERAGEGLPWPGRDWTDPGYTGGGLVTITTIDQISVELEPRADGGWDAHDMTPPLDPQSCSHKRGVSIGEGGIRCADCQTPMMLTTRSD